uniref:Retinoic acid induced 14 n=1 Tax=Leptobrachium leishanense TaxID=445787 RepID=A0A8C5LRQ6_9ANUR
MKSLKAKFRKSDTNEWSKNDERLLQAVDHGEADKVASLLGKKGVTATKLDTDGKTAFHLAAMKGFADCLKVMLSHGVEVSSLDVKGHTALHLAVLHNHIDCAKKLLQCKCPLDSSDAYGKTSLHYAAANGSLPAVQLLSEHKSPLNVKDWEGNTPLHISILHGHTDVLKCLLDHQADVNMKDKNGRTPLVLACESGNLPMVEILVRMGADLKLTDALGHDALHFSRLSGNQQVVNFLLSRINQEPGIKSPTKPVQHDQITRLSSEGSGTPKKRQAPAPPTGSPLQSDVSPPLSSMSTPLSAAGQVFFPEQTSKVEIASPRRDYKDRMSDSTGEDSLFDLSSDLEHNVTISALQAKISYLTLLNQELQDKLKVPSEAMADISCDSFHSTQTELNTSHENEETKSPLFTPDNSDISFDSQPDITTRESKVKRLEEAMEEMQLKLTQSEDERKKLEDQINSVSSTFRHSVGSEGLEEAQEMEIQLQGKEEETVENVQETAPEGQDALSVAEKFEALQKEYAAVVAESDRKEGALKDLQGQLDAVTHSMANMVPADGQKEMERSYCAVLEKVNQEKVELHGMYLEKEEEIVRLQKELESQIKLGSEEQGELEKNDLVGTIEQLKEQVCELSLLYKEAQLEIGKLRQSSCDISSDVIPKDEHVKLLEEVKESKEKVDKDLADLVSEHNRTLEEVRKFRQEQEEDKSPLVSEHVKVIEALESTVSEMEAERDDLREQLTIHEAEVNSLQDELQKETTLLQESLVIRKTLEQQQVTLEDEISSLSLELGDLMKEKEKLSMDYMQIKKEVVQLKGDKEALQSQLMLKEQEVNETHVKYGKAQEDLQDLKKYRENTSKVEEKDKKIVELSKEVSKLKEALNSLSQLSFTTSTPKRQTQQLETLQHQVKQLQNQLTEAKKQHQEIVSVYRTHLLYAVQGQMDEDVQKVLKQILTMCKSQPQKM